MGSIQWIITIERSKAMEPLYHPHPQKSPLRLLFIEHLCVNAEQYVKSRSQCLNTKAKWTITLFHMRLQLFGQAPPNPGCHWVCGVLNLFAVMAHIAKLSSDKAGPWTDFSKQNIFGAVCRIKPALGLKRGSCLSSHYLWSASLASNDVLLERSPTWQQCKCLQALPACTITMSRDVANPGSKSEQCSAVWHPKTSPTRHTNLCECEHCHCMHLALLENIVIVIVVRMGQVRCCRFAALPLTQVSVFQLCDLKHSELQQMLHDPALAAGCTEQSGKMPQIRRR